MYFSIGKFVSENSREGKWGTSAIESISELLQKELPGLRGFSRTSIKKMRQFYEQWSMLTNRPPLAVDMQSTDDEHLIDTTQLLQLNRPPMAADLDLQDFFDLGFTHHIEILSKTKTLEERVFYIHQAAVMHWDKYKLRDMLKADLFHHQAKLPNNFLQTIPKHQQALKAIEMFKDEYLLDFINVEELGVRDPQDIDERVIENSIVQNPSVGIILCKDADKAYVEYVLQDYNKPMGVATYKVTQERLRELLPPEEEMKRLISAGE